MDNYPLSSWEIRIILYLYKMGYSWFADLTRMVTKHPYRTSKLIKRLYKNGLIKKETRYIQLLPGTKPYPQTIITLTDKGKKIAEELIKQGYTL